MFFFIKISPAMMFFFHIKISVLLVTGNDPLVVGENARLLKLVDTKEGSWCGVVVEQVQLVCRQLDSFPPSRQCVFSTA